ncbi:SoxR reducing system RseC family protein [Hahella sp. SMD15-11]|uniref:SoxR reducing system RseC family protein n=1 Tax=Thermohahella caldifontis TaxID=3142973 RepID=A0AB39V0U5_9GAMM
MIRETGIVRETAPGRVWVETRQQSSCSHCKARDSCPSGAVAGLREGATCRIEIRTDEPLRPGDQVEIGLPEEALVRGAVTQYLLPLAGLVAGAVTGAHNGWPEGVQLLSALAGMGVGLMLVRRLQSQSPRAANLEPRILRRC